MKTELDDAVFCNLKAYNAVTARNQNLLGQKIHETRKIHGMSLEAVRLLLQRYGVSVQVSAISKWEQGQSLPNGYQLMAFCAAFDIEDAVSYFTGCQLLNEKGRKKVAEYRADLAASGRYAPSLDSAQIHYIDMPVSLLAASAGTGNFLDDDNFETVSVPDRIVPPGADFGVRISGDSMEPAYQNGQIVWVKRCSELRPGEVGIFILDGEGYVKMYSEEMPQNIEERTDSFGVLHKYPVLISYNKKYSPIIVTEERTLQIIGKVL